MKLKNYKELFEKYEDTDYDDESYYNDDDYLFGRPDSSKKVTKDEEDEFIEKAKNFTTHAKSNSVTQEIPIEPKPSVEVKVIPKPVVLQQKYVIEPKPELTKVILNVEVYYFYQ